MWPSDSLIGIKLISTSLEFAGSVCRKPVLFSITYFIFQVLLICCGAAGSNSGVQEKKRTTVNSSLIIFFMVLLLYTYIFFDIDPVHACSLHVFHAVLGQRIAFDTHGKMKVIPFPFAGAAVFQVFGIG